MSSSGYSSRRPGRKWSPQRKINGKFLLVLILISTVTGGGIHALNIFQVNRQSGSLYQRAVSAEELGKKREAVKYLKRYLEFNDEDVDAKLKYGRLLDSIAETRNERLKAYLVLNEVLRSAPNRDEVARDLVRMAMEGQLFQDARDFLEGLIRDHPKDGQLRYQMARCMAAQSDHDDAVKKLEEAIELDTTLVEAYSYLAELLRENLNRPERADEVIEEMILANAQSPIAYLHRSRYRYDHKSTKEAKEDIDRARELDPDDADVLKWSGALAIESGQLDEARELFNRGLALHAKDSAMYIAMSSLEARAGKTGDAVSILKKGLEELPDDYRLLFALCEQYLDDGNIIDGRKSLSRLQELHYIAPALDYLEARVLAETGAWRDAVQILERIRPQLGSQSPLSQKLSMLMVRCYEALGDQERIISSSQQAVTENPQSVTAKYGLATALFAAGRIDDSFFEFREVMTMPGAPPQGWAMMARVLLIKTLRQPSDQRNWGELERVLNQAERATPDAVEIPLLRAEALAAREKFDEARKLTRTALGLFPKEVILWNFLAGLEEQAGNPDAGLAVLEEARQEAGDSVALRIAIASHWSRRGGEGANKALSNLQTGSDSFSSEGRLELLNGLATAQFRFGNYEAAGNLWKQVAASDPRNLECRLFIFDLALHAKDTAAMDEATAEIRKVEGDDGVFWKYAEAAKLLLQAKKDDLQALQKARERINQVAARRPNWSRVPLLQAELDDLEGLPDRALSQYLVAYNMGDMQPKVVRRIIQIYHEQGRFSEADQLLRDFQHRSNKPLSEDMGRKSAELAVRMGDTNRALRMAREHVSEDSKDYREHIWMGMVRFAAEQNDRAEDSLRKALELGGDDSGDPWISLVYFLVRTNQHDKAKTVVTELESRNTLAHHQLTLAQCYLALNDSEKVEKIYADLLENDAGNSDALRQAAQYFMSKGQRERAQPLLRSLMGGASGASSEVQAWARRALAIMLSTTGRNEDFSEALMLIELNLKQSENSDLERRAKAAVLATRIDRRQEAFHIFEELARRQKLSPREMFLLARLYDADRDWQKARGWLERLLGVAPRVPRYIAYYVNGLLRQKSYSAAESWLGRLVELAPDAMPTVELQVRLLHAQNKTVDAVELLRAASRRKNANLVNIASLFERIGQPKLAEEMYRKFVADSDQAHSVFALVGFLARQKQLSEALRLCEKAKEDCPIDAVALAGIGALRVGGPSHDQMSQVEEWLQEAIRKNPTHVALQITLAELRDLQGRYNESEAIYRRLLNQSNRNVIALNNLAWLLAMKFGKGEEARTLVDQAIGIAGDMPELLDTRAMVHLANKDPQAARLDMERVISQAPTASRYLHLSIAHMEAEDTAAAAYALEQSRALGLQPEALHPFDRATYDKIVQGLNSE